MSETTGTDVIREALRVRNRKSNLIAIARDIQVSPHLLDSFIERKASLSPDILRKLTTELWGGQAEFDAELNLLRSANKTPPMSMGSRPPRCERKPVDHPGYTMGPQPVKPERPKAKTPRPGWLGGWT